MTASDTTHHQTGPAATEASPAERAASPGSRQDNLRRMGALIAEITGLPESEVVPEADLVEDLYIDSVAKIELMVACETRFGVHIPDEISAGLRTVSAVLDHLEAPQAPQAAS
ncbi:acyl carrier protein [Streptomyces sp. NPDC023723]|uniref:acyl carrier protein n=1 Tax=Streptomyces sp. NPDC023723 TaxID=3154323 RepID=UPI0033F7470E